MSVDTLIRKALDHGIELRFVDGQLKVTGKRSAVTAWAPKLREHKDELIEAVIESSKIADQVLRAAMRVCDRYNDSDSAREAMRQDVANTPPHLLPDLLEHFRTSYPSPMDKPL